MQVLPGAEDSSVHTLSRREVAERLGVSTSTVRRLEFDALRPMQDVNGIWRFDPTEVEALAPRFARRTSPARSAPAPRDQERLARARAGRLAAKVFRLFARNFTLQQIVVATRQPPDAIRDLYREWSMSLDQGEWERRDRNT